MKLLGVVVASALQLTSSEAAVRPGVDVVRSEPARLTGLRGKRIGLVTNHTGQGLDGTSTLSVLRDELSLDVVALFSPEHGFSGDAAAGSEVSSDESGPIPVFSLYGDIRAPTREMLERIDVVVFDIQDVGVRFYTYISTMKLTMDAAAAAGVAFVVLDRPNPNGGQRVEAPVLDPEFASFVGVASIPLVHGMTVGELAHFFKTDALELDVVLVEGWTRDMMWDDTGLEWVAPSPNIRTARAALAYPALGLVEGANVSEGRGLEETFERVGAPWIHAGDLSAALNALELPGVSFRPTSFTPRSLPAAPSPKYLGERCHGVELVVTAPRQFEAVRTGLAVLATIRTLHQDELVWVRDGERVWLDALLGTDRPRLAIEVGIPIEQILEAEATALVEFQRLRADHLLY